MHYCLSSKVTKNKKETEKHEQNMVWNKKNICQWKRKNPLPKTGNKLGSYPKIWRKFKEATKALSLKEFSSQH